MGFLIHLSVSLLLLSLFKAYGDEISMSFYQQRPNHAAASPSSQPAASPAPHHNKGGHHHHHHSKPPTKAPVQPPTKAPAAHPPTTYPVPTRKLVAVQGVVYCKSCKYPGVNTLTDAYPIKDAVVKIVCRNTKYPTEIHATTDKNGYFFILAPKNITTYGSHKCLASLVSSPLAKCNQPTGMHFGLKGAMLIPPNVAPVSAPAHAPAAAAAPVKPLPYDVFTVGPFAFEPSSKLPCT